MGARRGDFIQIIVEERWKYTIFCGTYHIPPIMELAPKNNTKTKISKKETPTQTKPRSMLLKLEWGD
jgi:hypothetical protein